MTFNEHSSRSPGRHSRLVLLLGTACSAEDQGAAGREQAPRGRGHGTRRTAPISRRAWRWWAPWPPKFSADVKAEYPGTVSQILVDRVGAREERARSSPASTPARARPSVLQAKAEAARADREYERALKLKEAGLMTAQGLEDAQTIRESRQGAARPRPGRAGQDGHPRPHGRRRLPASRERRATWPATPRSSGSWTTASST